MRFRFKFLAFNMKIDLLVAKSKCYPATSKSLFLHL